MNLAFNLTFFIEFNYQQKLFFHFKFMNRSQVQYFRELIRNLQGSMLKTISLIGENTTTSSFMFEIFENIDDVLKKLLTNETNDEKNMMSVVSSFMYNNAKKINECRNRIQEIILNNEELMKEYCVFENIERFNKYANDFWKGIITEKDWKEKEKKIKLYMPLNKRFGSSSYLII